MCEPSPLFCFQEELAEGLHLIDFEQLKIENQTYNEKIEERNEELLKLRRKITTTVQVLTHLKEKLQFVQVENKDLNDSLRMVEANVATVRLVYIERGIYCACLIHIVLVSVQV